MDLIADEHPMTDPYRGARDTGNADFFEPSSFKEQGITDQQTRTRFVPFAGTAASAEAESILTEMKLRSRSFSAPCTARLPRTGAAIVRIGASKLSVGEISTPTARAVHIFTIYLSAFDTETWVDETHVFSGLTEAGMVHHLPPKRTGRFHLSEGHDMLQVYLPCDVLKRTASEMGLRYEEVFDDERQTCDVDWVVEPIARSVVVALESQMQYFGRNVLDNLVVALTAALIERRCVAGAATLPSSAAGLAPWRLRKAVSFIESRLGENPTLEQMADAAGLSTFHFSRMFKKSTGMPPHRFLLERRIERARELLSATELKIVEIALDLGFSTQEHFTHAFRKLVGTTPRSYRNALRV